MQLTLDEAATQLGKTVRQVRYLIEKEELPARKIGGRWFIESDDLPRNAAKKGVDERRERGLRRAVEDALELPASSRRYSVTDLKAFQVALPLYQRSEAAVAPSGSLPATRDPGSESVTPKGLFSPARGCEATPGSEYLG